jgi:transcriptional regulator with XRE-family HTH domain
MGQPKAHFGTMLRERRIAKGYSLRKFAEMVDVSPTYLSRVETGQAEYAPSAERVRVMAEVLGEDPDQWIALAGRMPEDLKGIILKKHEAMPALLRAAQNLSVEDLKKITEQLERRKREGKKP